MATIKEIQQRLVALGYDPGKVDGKAGPQTKLAVKLFQSDKGLTSDGVVGKQTEAALFGKPVVKPTSDAMHVSAQGRKKITTREGNVLTAYQDSVNIWTIGVGHTAAAGLPKPVKGMVITLEQSDEILSRDLVQFEDAVNKAITKPMSQNEFDAMVSLAFNIGTGAFEGSTLVKKFNAGDKDGAADQFLVWNKANGKVLKGLSTRRADERKQFLTKD